MHELLTLQEASEQTGVPVGALRRAIRRGALPAQTRTAVAPGPVNALRYREYVVLRSDAERFAQVYHERRQNRRPKRITKLHEVRMKLGLPYRQLADALGLSYSYWRALEYGGMTPSVERAVMIAQALGVRVEDLWPLEGFDE